MFPRLLGSLQRLAAPRSNRRRAGLTPSARPSGAGTLGFIDPDTVRYRAIAEVPRFTRGLDFARGLAVVGLSPVRDGAVVSGIPITERLAEDERICSVCVVELAAGRVVALWRFQTAGQEAFAVPVLPGRRRPELINDDDTRPNNRA
jgi:uncharacterized protein (TIGR03032 family)